MMAIRGFTLVAIKGFTWWPSEDSPYRPAQDSLGGNHWNIAAHVCTHGAILSDLAQFRKTRTISLYRTDVIAHAHIHFLSYTGNHTD